MTEALQKSASEQATRSQKALKKAQDLNFSGWKYLEQNKETILSHITYLLLNAKKEDAEQVKVALALLEKFAPNAPDPTPKGANSVPIVPIQVNIGANLDRRDPTKESATIEIPAK